MGAFDPKKQNDAYRDALTKLTLVGLDAERMEFCSERRDWGRLFFEPSWTRGWSDTSRARRSPGCPPLMIPEGQ